MRPYSGNLRDRFCRALSRGMSARGAARHLEVSESTGVKWAQRWRESSKLVCGKMGGHRPRKLESEREWLLARHAREKDITLHAVLADLEAVRGVVVSCDTQWRFLRANGITFKKKDNRSTCRGSRTPRCRLPRRFSAWR
jgi:transposase